MNKQQMIDKVIEGLKSVYRYTDFTGSEWQHICTRKEFEDRGVGYEMQSH